MKSPPLNIVLFQPEIPQNTGSVARTCVATGAKLWLVRPLGFRIDDYYVRRAGLDYWQYLNLQVVDDWDDLKVNLPIDEAYFFTKKTSQFYHQVPYQSGHTLVFGCESQGLPDWMLEEYSDRCLRIPVTAEARCLNLSNAVCAASYEVLRQLDALPIDE